MRAAAGARSSGKVVIGPALAALEARQASLDAFWTRCPGTAGRAARSYGSQCTPGAWLSLVERRVWDAEVGGSNPPAPIGGGPGHVS